MRAALAHALGKLVSVLALTTMLCMSFGHATRADDKTLTIGITQFPSTLHPNIDSMLAKTYVLAMVQRPFTVYDHDWKLICMLCTQLPTIENGMAEPVDLEDGKRGIKISYEINPDATWGDGTPVTTEDVRFTWEIGRHPKSGVSNFELYRRITEVEIHDERRFTLHVDKLTFEYNAINDFRLVPAHLEKEPFAAPEDYKNRTSFDTDPTNPGLYYGPYRITEVSSGAYLVLEPNPTWWGQKPSFERIVIKVIENTAALEANLLSGGVDMIAGELGLKIDQGIAFKRRHGKRFNVIFKAGLIYEHIDLNLENPILRDSRVRRALLHALDRDSMTRQLFGGEQPVAHSPVSPLDWVHTDDLNRYGYDPELAEALLDEAGWTREGLGIRKNAAGEPLRLEIMTTAGDRTRELVQQVLQNQWQQVGIEVPVRNQPARVLFGETIRKRQFPAMAMYAWYSAPENVPRTTLHSSMIPSEDNNWAGQNYTGYRDERMDQLIDAIEIELDRDKRYGLWTELQQLYTEHLPVLPLYYRADVHVYPKWLEGVRPTGHQGPSTLWVETWKAADAR